MPSGARCPRCSPDHDRTRPSASERGYGARWRKARAAYLAKHPLCIMCQQHGRLTAATVVDHKTPHKGDAALFWDSANWQGLCVHHHSSTKQRQERAQQPREGVTGSAFEPDRPETGVGVARATRRELGFLA